MSKVLDIQPNQFKSEVIDFAGKVVVDFYGPKCGPCQTMVPLLDELADEYANEVKFVKVDATQSYKLAAEHGVTTVPTFMLFDNGEKQKRESGTKTKIAFYKWIDS
ncbi:thioredoxin family protein [Rubellicoccus peritrichatus]|uniref:Thioredoxin n=1 Tax=Rubellicoccus peritrichatus TaxID=3080537 RepID=A0AAQ3LCS5_9BACT|nr:thioredoxin domain-containing protein [Puniceicoccus sp. CR14]WOO39559.1 thioredoxin domain-containing protein [Puniceicoccus sp. CR14]